jgi:hypothetical protein
MTTLSSTVISTWETSSTYSGSPWNYTGSESVTSVPSDVVDRVLVELRTGTSSGTKVATRAAFLKSNGTIVDLDGSSRVTFTGKVAGNYFIVVRHRNHLAVMSANPVSLSASSSLYDFTTGLAEFYGGDAADLGGGVYGMYAGDANTDGVINYALDAGPVWNDIRKYLCS